MWSALFLTILFSCHLSTEAGVLYASAPQNQGQYYRKDPGTSYNYGYNTGDGVAKVEVKRKDGSVVGSYRYFDPNGKQIVRSYIADSKGFRILGNDLPINPETPAAAVIGAPALTASVEGAHQQVVDSAQDPTKEYSTVDIENIAAPTHSVSSFSPFTFGDSTVVSRNVVGTVNNDRNNFYAFPFRYNYDFPAGFAYPTVLRAVPLPRFVVGGARRVEPEKNTINVGKKTTTLERKEPFGIVGRKLTPVLKRPYVVGKRY